MTGKQTLNRNGDRSLYVGLQDHDVPRVNALLVANGLRVAELSPQNATLEDVFLKLTKSKSAADSRG